MDFDQLENGNQDLVVGEVVTFTGVASTGISPPPRPQNCMVIGNHTTPNPTTDNSTIIAIGLNRFRYPDSNFNVGHMVEGNSETKQVLFYGPVEADGGFAVPETLHITKIEKCDACGFDLQKNLKEFDSTTKDNQELVDELARFTDDISTNDMETEVRPEGVPGMTWGGRVTIGHLCFDCIRDVAIEYRAKKSWQEKNGDPIRLLQQQVASLTADLLKEKARIDDLQPKNGDPIRDLYIKTADISSKVDRMWLLLH